MSTAISISDVDDPKVKAQLKLYDVDADGSVSISELVSALKKHQSTQHTARNLKYLLATCAVLVAILVALTSVTTWAIVDGSKDTETNDNDELTSRSTGHTMSVKQSQVSIPFGALSKLDTKLLKLSEIQFRDEGTDIVYVKQAASFEVYSSFLSSSVNISCTDGTQIRVTGLQDAIATLPSGQEVFFCASCTGCGLRSVSTPDVVDAIQGYAAELAAWAPTCTAARNMYLNRTGQFNETEEGTGESDRRRFLGSQWLRGGCMLSFVPCYRKSTFKWVNDEDLSTLDRLTQHDINMHCPNAAGVCAHGTWNAIQRRCVQQPTQHSFLAGTSVFEACPAMEFDKGNLHTYYSMKPEYRATFASRMNQVRYDCANVLAIGGTADITFGTATFKDVCGSNRFIEFWRRNGTAWTDRDPYADASRLFGTFYYLDRGCTNSKQAINDWIYTTNQITAHFAHSDTTRDAYALMFA